MGATTVCFLSTVSPELMDRGKSPLLIYKPSCTLRVMSSAVTFAYLRVLERTEELSPFLRVYGILFFNCNAKLGTGIICECAEKIISKSV